LIFFCEDCGEKNILKEKNIKDKNIEFICSVCKYNNCYTLPENYSQNIRKNNKNFDQDFLDKQIKDLLQQIKNFPQIIDIFVFHRNGTILNNNCLKSSDTTDYERLKTFNSEDLHIKQELTKIGKSLIKNYLFAQACFSDLNEVILSYNNKTIFFEKINKDLFIAVISKQFLLPVEFKKIFKPTLVHIKKLI